MSSLASGQSADGAEKATALSAVELASKLRQRQSPVKRGEKWYVLSLKWYNQARAFHLRDSDAAPAPGQIDNEHLLNPLSPNLILPWSSLKQNLQESFDYELVPEDVYCTLKAEHGIVSEAHEIKRETYELPKRSMFSRTEVTIDLYPMCCNLFNCDNGNGQRDTSAPKRVLVFGKRDTLPNVIDKAKVQLDTTNALKLRAWYRRTPEGNDGEVDEKAAEEDDSWKILSQDVLKAWFQKKQNNNRASDIGDDDEPLALHDIMLESKGRDGHWIRGPKADADVEIEDVPGWRSRLKVGDTCDAQDTAPERKPDEPEYVPKWFESKVMDVRPIARGPDYDSTAEPNAESEEELRVHFHGWKSTFDEWIPRMSVRIMPRFTKVPDWRSQLKANEGIEYKCEIEAGGSNMRWFEASVKKIDRAVEGNERVYIKNKFMERPEFACWVPLNSERLMPLYTHLKKPKSRGTGGLYRRNMYNSSGEAEAPGVVGLRNLGNTCYMNSILQCMSNTTVVTDFFLSGKFEGDVNLRNILGTGGKLARSYANLLKELWEGQDKSVAPREVKEEMGRVNMQFQGYQQQDSQELLNALVDSLHEDLNRVKNKPYTEGVEHGGRPDEIVARESWDAFLQRNRSHFVDTMYGQLRSHLTDPFNGKSSVTFDPFSSISVPIPISNDYDLTVTFVPNSSNGGPAAARVFDLTADKRGGMKKFVELVADATSIPLSRLCCVEVHAHKVYKMLYFPAESDSDNVEVNIDVKSLGRGDIIRIYELDHENAFTQGSALKLWKEHKKSKGASKQQETESSEAGTLSNDGTAGPTFQVYLVFSQNVKYSYSTYAKPENIGEPIVLTLPSDASGKHVWDQVDKLISPLLNGTNIEVSASGDAETAPLTGDESGAKVGEGTKSLFDLRLIDQQAYTEYDDIPNDDAVRLLDIIGAQKRSSYSYSYRSSSSQFCIRVLVNDEGTKILSIPKLSGKSAPMHESQVADTDNASPNSPKKLTLDVCLQKYKSREQLGENDMWYSPFSKKHVQAFKEMAIWSLPEILIIQLKRFSYERGTYSVHREKVTSVVHFPIKGLEMEPYVTGPIDADKGSVYDLYAISNHMGGLGGGHYTAYAKNQGTKKWYCFDDASVSEISEKALVTANAYVLFYKRRNNEEDE